MIIVLHGKDSDASYARLAKLLESYNDYPKIRLDAKAQDAQIIQEVFTSSLFESKKLIVVENFLAPLKKLPKYLEKIPTEVILIFWEGTDLTPAKIKGLQKLARVEYGLSGAVQHGASTLPGDAFDKFPQTGTAEVHLATEFQNMIYEHEQFPKDLREEIYDYLREACADEKKEGQTDEQFIYMTRKKGFGPFKEKVWNLSDDIKNNIGAALENKFVFLFDKLNVGSTKKIVDETIKPIEIMHSLQLPIN